MAVAEAVSVAAEAVVAVAAVVVVVSVVEINESQKRMNKISSNSIDILLRYCYLIAFRSFTYCPDN